MSVPLSDTRPFGVVFDRPDADRNHAWGPFASFDAAARFAEFVEAEIDPAHVIPWADAEALPGVRVLDAVTELLNWRTSVALPQTAEVDRLRAENEQLADDAARDVARERERAGRCERDVVEARAEAKKLRAELATAQASIRAVETVKCWTNEDGRRFVFAEDLAFALGYTPSTPAAPTS